MLVHNNTIDTITQVHDNSVVIITTLLTVTHVGYRFIAVCSEVCRPVPTTPTTEFMDL